MEHYRADGLWPPSGELAGKSTPTPTACPLVERSSSRTVTRAAASRKQVGSTRVDVGETALEPPRITIRDGANRDNSATTDAGSELAGVSNTGAFDIPATGAPPTHVDSPAHPARTRQGLASLSAGRSDPPPEIDSRWGAPRDHRPTAAPPSGCSSAEWKLGAIGKSLVGPKGRVGKLCLFPLARIGCVAHDAIARTRRRLLRSTVNAPLDRLSGHSSPSRTL